MCQANNSISGFMYIFWSIYILSLSVIFFCIFVYIEIWWIFSIGLVTCLFLVKCLNWLGFTTVDLLSIDIRISDFFSLFLSSLSFSLIFYNITRWTWLKINVWMFRLTSLQVCILLIFSPMKLIELSHIYMYRNYM